MSLTPGHMEFFEDADIDCGDVVIAQDGMLVDYIKPHTPRGEKVRFIASSHPIWMETDGTVPENCPRNPDFDTGQALGCLCCAQATLATANGNHIIVGTGIREEK
ncbi:MAG TPA: hypothetical protein PKD15_05165 [Candidatus Saccharibacteria bacterium]|nr:hypothetical protein [Candidatus Saccharibacteria bacterium]